MITSTLQRAIEIATLAHQGQVDKDGNDYIGHPLRVMEMGKTENERIVGVPVGALIVRMKKLGI